MKLFWIIGIIFLFIFPPLGIFILACCLLAIILNSSKRNTNRKK